MSTWTCLTWKLAGRRMGPSSQCTRASVVRRMPVLLLEQNPSGAMTRAWCVAMSHVVMHTSCMCYQVPDCIERNIERKEKAKLPVLNCIFSQGGKFGNF